MTSRQARGSLTATAVKPLKLQLSDGSTVSSGDSTSDPSETETEDVLRHQKPASGPSKPRFSAATRKLLKGGGRAGGSQGEIMSSLSRINGQLGELLTKLNQPPPAYPGGILHTGLLPDQAVPPTISLSSGGQRLAVAYQTAVPFHSKQSGYRASVCMRCGQRSSSC